MPNSVTHGRYTPSCEALITLADALGGSRGDILSEGFLAPSYLPKASLEALLLHCFDLCKRDGFREDELAVEEAIAEFCREQAEVQKLVQMMARSKMRVFNHYALCKRLPKLVFGNRGLDAFLEDAELFVTELLVQHSNTVDFYRRCFDFSEAELRLYETFVAKTVKSLFVMGYPDAVHHCSQVGRLCVVKASNGGASRPELLQVAMVGWFHDPKLDVSLSIDNLCTHPVVASAFARLVLTEPTFKRSLESYLEAYPLSFEGFVIGLCDALSINNDSRFVAEQFIFDQVALQIIDLKGVEDGGYLKCLLWMAHQKRLSAPSRGQKPEPFSDEIEALLKQTTLDSGLVAIDRGVWDEVCAELELDGPYDALYESILNGECLDKPVIQRLSSVLITRESELKDVLRCWPVSGLFLFSHHDEVSDFGACAAFSLVNSDPLLLSPHKILEVRRVEEPLIERLKSYISSLDSNVNDLPQIARTSALSWQRSVYISILKASRDLTGVNRLASFFQSHDYTPVQTDVDVLRNLVLESATWQSFLHCDMTEENADAFQSVLEALKRHYLDMCREYREAAIVESVDESKMR